MSLTLSSLTGFAASSLPPELEGIGIDAQLGAQLAINDIRVRDEGGAQRPLADFFMG